MPELEDLGRRARISIRAAEVDALVELDAMR
jgi:hypothetical protein